MLTEVLLAFQLCQRASLKNKDSPPLSKLRQLVMLNDLARRIQHVAIDYIRRKRIEEHEREFAGQLERCV